MKRIAALAMGLAHALPAYADDYPKECNPLLAAIMIAGVEAFCRKALRVTDEGSLIAEKLMQSGDCEKIAYNQLQIDLDRLGARDLPPLPSIIFAPHG